MTIPSDDVLALLVQEGQQQRILVIEAAPEGKLGLKHDAELIGCHEGGFGGTPRVEAHVVQPVGGAFAQVVPPGFDIHRHMACQWPDACIVLTAQENLMPIGIEMPTFDVEIVEEGRE